MPTTATVSGSIQISSVTIPIKSAIPPNTSGELVFSYDLPAGQDPTNILTVGDFTAWAASQLSAPANFGLPSSLTSLSVGVSHLLIDTAGKFQIGVLFGSNSGGKWVASWKPIDALPFSFNNLLLEVDYASATAPVSLPLSNAANKGDTSLTFASTTGVTAGMTVSGSGIAAGTTAGAVTDTTVALSTGTSGAMAVGQSITFTPAS